ncbi:hypothetical protein AND_000535 [Anopheles darlingi]|uniref:MADF domain-containing protein n=1 Tax=Anopheles darlingi TaxID=43151 RepID=W5JWX0_ANODA|nr:hypothetical protein AND_000535 [Anopheles darlingi]
MASYRRRKDEDRAFWREFIGLYRRLPDLWNGNSNGYLDRNKREASYKILVDKMKQFDPRADKASVCTKINSLRSTYRRELNKVKAMRGTGEEYVPSLYYFDDMSFLRDQENSGICSPAMRKKGEFVENGEESKFMEENTESEVDEGSSHESQHLPESSWQPTCSKQPTLNESSRESEESKRAKLLSLAYKRLTNPPSENELLVKSWLADYEKLSPDQQLYAKKFINDVLFEGQLGNLHRYAITVNNAPQPSASFQHAQRAHPQGHGSCAFFSLGASTSSNANPPDPSPSPHSNDSTHCDSSRASRQVEEMHNSALVGSLQDVLKEEQFD